jgi:hypothetical protein
MGGPQRSFAERHRSVKTAIRATAPAGALLQPVRAS